LSAAEPSPRERLLAELRAGGVTDERILAALGSVPREGFVPEPLRERAYDNVALPIAGQQTISQPVVVAQMAQAARLRTGDHVLEIGTGSGYGAAVLSRLAGDVVTVEIRRSLAEAAMIRLRELGYANVRVVIGDGSLGWPELAPYDAIIVTAAAPEVPPRLLRQLCPEGGRLVAPIGSFREQRLVVAERHANRVKVHPLGHVRFVPLVGEAGFTLLDPARRN
jgi:protein-L-isoaspartate(D-aspartate) O-methyltransferase